jgi:hypothetical protein
METFKNFIELDEALITFGRKAYPNFGNVVILAGGAGSGKGFVLSNLLGIEGKVMDVDALKTLALKSDLIARRVRAEMGIDLKSLDLQNPENVSRLHEILADVYGLVKANQQRVFSAALAAPPNRKPNLIFDVTLKDMSKLESITRNARNLGYETENIHLVWVLNDIEMARAQNLERERVVPDEILLATHEGASITMARIMKLGEGLKRYMDGDIYIVFNKRGSDTTMIDSPRGGGYVLKSNYLQIKKKSSKVMRPTELTKEIRNKVADYTPDTPTWDE